MHKHIAPLVLLLFTLLAPTLALSEIHKWVDEHGQVHYGQSVPEAYTSRAIDTRYSNIIDGAGEGSGFILDSLEHGISRRSSSYRNFRLKKPDPGLCRSACQKDDKCKSWTYGKPGYFNADKGRCWLQWEVAQPRGDKHCISGVKQRIITNMAPMEKNTNYAVKPYKHFTLSKNEPKLCMAQCAFDERCLAWSYSAPVEGKSPFPRCWLKDTLTESIADENVVSGLKKR